VRALVALLFPHLWRGQLAEASRLLASGAAPPEGVGAKLDAWLAAPAWEVRNVAVKLIARLRDSARYVRLLQKLTDRAEAGIVRRNAAEAIRGLGLSTPPARSALLQALSDPYWEVRAEAAIALAALFPPAEDLERAILNLLLGPKPQGPQRIRERNFEVRMAAALALGHLGLSRQAFDVLAALAEDDSWLVRSQAAVGLAHFAARKPDFLAEASSRIEAVDRLSEGAVSFFVHRDVLARVLRAVGDGPPALSPEALRPIYLDPKAGWNKLRS